MVSEESAMGERRKYQEYDGSYAGKRILVKISQEYSDVVVNNVRPYGNRICCWRFRGAFPNHAFPLEKGATQSSLFAMAVAIPCRDVNRSFKDGSNAFSSY